MAGGTNGDRGGEQEQTGRTGPADGPGHMTGGAGRGAGPSPSRRGVLAVSAAAGLGVLTGCGSASTDSKSGAGSASSSPSKSPTPKRTKRRPQLPRGGRELFPRYRLVGYCGLPGAAALGKLGDGDPGKRAAEIEKTAREYGDGREPLPVLELLAAVANPTAGPDGEYRTRTPSRTIERFHGLARENDALLMLNVQPGRSSMLDEVKALGDWLKHPDVGVAIDPEWDMGPGEVPGETYGRTEAGEINDIADYLSGLVEEEDLPHKALVFHQVSSSVVGEEKDMRPADGVSVIKSADGIGSPGLKRGTWEQLVEDMPDGIHTGFKLFYEEDAETSRLMKPKEVLGLKPKPEYVMYE